jgi:tetratricopeptide (TPR) repeat protein
MELEKLVSLIAIPDNGNFTPMNNIYFIFPNNPKSIKFESALSVLCILLFFFIGGFFCPIEFKYISWAISFIFCSFFIFKDRYFRYYKKAALQNSFSRYKKMMYYMNKIIADSKIYKNGMPLCYYVIKSKKLLEIGDVGMAEELIDTAIREYPEDILSKYIKGVCLYRKGNIKGARDCWADIVRTEGNLELCNELKTMLSEIS